MREPLTSHITSWSLRREMISGIEYEVERVSLSRDLSNNQVQRVLTEQAERGGWELIRLRRHRDRRREAWLRRKVIKVRLTLER